MSALSAADDRNRSALLPSSTYLIRDHPMSSCGLALAIHSDRAFHPQISGLGRGTIEARIRGPSLYYWLQLTHPASRFCDEGSAYQHLRPDGSHPVPRYRTRDVSLLTA